MGKGEGRAGEQWYEKTIAGNVVLSYASQKAMRHRFADWPGAEDQIGSSQRHAEDLIGLSKRYVEELEKSVQRGT